MSILVVTHPRGGSAGNFASVAEVLKRELILHDASETPLPNPNDFSALVVMGGRENTDEKDLYPYLEDEVDYIGDWLDSGKPFLGVCLGSQLLTEAIGGEVYRLPEIELGWCEVEHNTSAHLDPVLASGGRKVALQWHRHSNLHPQRAQILAGNAKGVQAFRFANAWGVQFHPEGNVETLKRWTDSLRNEEDDEEMAAAIEQGAIEHGRTWRGYGSSLFGRFLALSD